MPDLFPLILLMIGRQRTCADQIAGGLLVAYTAGRVWWLALFLRLLRFLLLRFDIVTSHLPVGHDASLQPATSLSASNRVGTLPTGLRLRAASRCTCRFTLRLGYLPELFR